VKDLDLWLAFAAFHAGDYQRAIDVSQSHILGGLVISTLKPRLSVL